ncbi:membrane protein [Verrucomicrobiota bacterium]|nr:membrane protein [Verrucomicrobiota bacterium]
MTAILTRIALFFDGSWSRLTERLGVPEWSFAPGGKILLFAGAAVALVLVVVCYRRTTEGLTLRSRLGLGALRFVSLILLLTLVSGAVCSVDVFRTQRPELLLLVDDSPSMSLPDGGSTRLAAVEQTLSQGGLLRRLENQFTVRLRHTGESTSPGATTDAPAPPQDLARSLIREAAQPASQPLAHILLISDGVQSSGERLSRAAAELPAPVSSLVVGQADARDVILENISVPPFVYARDRVLVSAELRSPGISGEATLRLVNVRAGAEKEIATAKATLAPGGEPLVARLEFPATDPGLQRFILRVEPVPGELTALNNDIAFHLDVRPEKIRVLFVEGEPSWEYRYARQSLLADPAVEFHGLVRLPGDEWFYQGPANRADNKPVLRAPRDGFPTTTAELNYFDVLILGDLERKVFEQARRFELVEAFVGQRGGGLATIGGMKVYAAGNYEGTLLAQMLPVEIVREKTMQLVNRFNVQPTSQGLVHPVLQLEGDPVKNEQAWAGLPWVEGGNAWRTLKPGATPLLLHPTLRTPAGPRPVAAAWPYGAGRIYSTALDGTWHWRLARKSEADYHQRFWGLLIRWLAGDPRLSQPSAPIMLDDPLLEVGKPAGFSLSLRDPEGAAFTDAQVEFTVEAPAGGRLLARAASDPAVPGRYALRYTPAHPGDHVIKAVITGPGDEKREQQLTCTVSPSRAEFRQILPDTAALAGLAAASGGTSLPLAKHADLKLPAAPSSVAVQHVVVNVWQAPGVLVLLLVCLCAEWLLRKRRGLA